MNVSVSGDYQSRYEQNVSSSQFWSCYHAEYNLQQHFVTIELLSKPFCEWSHIKIQGQILYTRAPNLELSNLGLNDGNSDMYEFVTGQFISRKQFSEAVGTHQGASVGILQIYLLQGPSKSLEGFYFSVVILMIFGRNSYKILI